MTLDWLHLVALLGAIQGGFLAAVLATQQRNRTANRLLAVLMIAFSIHLASGVYYAAGLVGQYPQFFGVSYPLPLIYGPLVFLYALAASDRTRRLGWQDALHFVPFAAVVLASMPIYLSSGPEKLEFLQNLQRGILPLHMQIAEPVKFVSGVSYAVITLVFLRRHRAKVKDSYSTVERVNLDWLLRLAIASAVIWTLATTFAMTEGVSHPILERSDDIVALGMAVTVYATGYIALRQPEIFNFAAIDHGATDSVPATVPPTPPPQEAPEPIAIESVVAAEPSGARYERSGLTDTEAERLERGLIAAMEMDHLYQNSELTLADLADRLDTSPHKLSEVLNSQLNQTFYDFVNAYRVKDVQRRIADAGMKHLTILALAMNAGFASKSTFNHVFRQHTGYTPSAYRRSLTEGSAAPG